MWEQLAELHELGLFDAHEDGLLRDDTLLVDVFPILLLEAQSLDGDIGFKVLQDLVVAEVAVGWKVEHRQILYQLIVFIVEHLHNALSDEVQVLHCRLIGDDGLAMGEQSAEHLDDQLVGEASLALVEEVLEMLFEVIESLGQFDELRLHLWGDLLVEVELFNDQIEVVLVGLLNVLSDVIVELWLQMERVI